MHLYSSEMFQFHCCGTLTKLCKRLDFWRGKTYSSHDFSLIWIWKSKYLPFWIEELHCGYILWLQLGTFACSLPVVGLLLLVSIGQLKVFGNCGTKWKVRTKQEENKKSLYSRSLLFHCYTTLFYKGRRTHKICKRMTPYKIVLLHCRKLHYPKGRNKCWCHRAKMLFGVSNVLLCVLVDN